MNVDARVLDRLYATVEARKGADPSGSYTAALFAKGRAKIAQKVGEEAVETVIEAQRNGDAKVKFSVPMKVVFDLEKDLVNKDKTVFSTTKPEAFIERFCSKLNMNNELTKLCQFISMKIEKMNIMPENTPHSIAAGVVYFIAQICKLNISKRDVKNVSEISEVTINKCFKKLEKEKTTLLPAVILKKYSTF
jgi:transcription initiation factor TFIIIB Brf1 subunit/transcription initiation factor TFIIB